MRKLALALVCFVGLACPVLAQTPAQIKDAISKLQAALADLQPATTSGGGAISPTADLQATLNAAACGTTIQLPAGATYTGAYTMSKACPTSPITLVGPSFPNRRVTLADVANWPHLKAASGANSALTITGSGYVVRGVEITGGSDVVTVAGTNVTLDQNYIHGAPSEDHKRGIALNGVNVTVTRNYISDFHVAGQDSQAVCGWTGAGPYLIQDNYLEAASENVLFGGADPTVTNLVPSNIQILGNTISKPLAWRTQAGWNVKNAIELKNAQHVTISGNVVENVWSDAQAGYLLVLTVRNQDGGCPWCIVQDVQVTGNVFRHGGGFANILAVDDTNPSGRMAAVAFSGNLVYDIDAAKYTGAADASGRLLQILNGVNGLTWDHNTIVGGTALGAVNSLIDFANGGPIASFPLTGFVYTNSVGPEGDYGVIGQGDLGGSGIAMLEHYAAGYVWSGNTLLLSPRGTTYTYPVGTVVAPTAQVVTAGYTLASGFTGGADIAALKASIPGLDLTQ